MDVVGVVSMGPVRNGVRTTREAELYTLYVHPHYWRGGIGGALQDAALQFLAYSGFDRAVLWVLYTNARARTFYARTGWEPTGLEKTRISDGLALHQVQYSRILQQRSRLHIRSG